MASPRDVPWAEIREAYESTDAGIAALAERYGFASKTTIKRRRDAEGWKKDAELVRANIATRAARGTDLGEGIVPPVCPPVGGGGTAGGHTETQQNGPLPEADTVGVPPPGHNSLSLVPTAAAEKQPSPGERVAMLAELQAKHQHKALKLAEQLQRVGSQVMDAIETILKGPDALDEGDELRGAWGRTMLTLRSINADKDTLKDFLKQGAATVEAGVKLERQVLGLDEVQTGFGAAVADGLPPSPLLSAEQVLQAAGADIDLIRLMVDANRKVQLLRPDIEGQAERINDG